ncbi:Glycosyl transferase family 2 [Paenibacillus sophorae]|uniref:Glucosyl-3-phosphoglycerate synthase n=1 Tax=Paenibacillus sophorae TaxID=1333845 RepID=A0A1H8Q651_9BACL|nr:glycosyltransferase [Paenibacillus sophorae]SEO49699.1 Glycosyl transferase family 2 [Paenibacillus sophorae]
MRIGIHPKPAGRSTSPSSRRRNALPGPASPRKLRERNGMKSAGSSKSQRTSLRTSPGTGAATVGRAAGRSAGSRPGRAAGRPYVRTARRALWTPPALHGKLSVIITACNEEKTLRSVLREAERLMPEEIIVVLNGCVDNSFRRARQCGRAIVVHCPDAVGHDVGRAIGSKLSQGDIMLFLDGDLPIPAPSLFPFVAAVDRGTDVALNDLNPLLPIFGKCDSVTHCKMFLNMALGREDLGAGSMTAVPHALSRRMLELIGPQALSVPPKAQAAAVLEKLRVENAGTVNVIKRNRIRKGNTGAGNNVEQMIIGDHAEALAEVLARGAADLLWKENGPDSRRILAAWRNGI